MLASGHEMLLLTKNGHVSDLREPVLQFSPPFLPKYPIWFLTVTQLSNSIGGTTPWLNSHTYTSPHFSHIIWSTYLDIYKIIPVFFQS